MHFPLHCFSLPVQKMVQEELGRVGFKTGGGEELTANKTPSPPLALCQNHFRYPEMGVSGCWLHSRAQRGLCPAQGFALGVWPSPGMPRVTSSSSGTCICPRVWARGELGSPVPQALTLSFFLEETQNP